MPLLLRRCNFLEEGFLKYDRLRFLTVLLNGLNDVFLLLWGTHHNSENGVLEGNLCLLSRSLGCLVCICRSDCNRLSCRMTVYVRHIVSFVGRNVSCSCLHWVYLVQSFWVCCNFPVVCICLCRVCQCLADVDDHSYYRRSCKYVLVDLDLFVHEICLDLCFGSSLAGVDYLVCFCPRNFVVSIDCLFIRKSFEATSLLLLLTPLLTVSCSSYVSVRQFCKTCRCMFARFCYT